MKVRSLDSRDGVAGVLYPQIPFSYTFKVPGTLQESGNMEDSRSPYWWLNSGAYLYIKDGKGETVQGELPKLSFWRLLYSKTNPIDTDGGYHPQNIFRLLTRSKWQDMSEEAYFRILKTSNSSSPNRNESNGILLLSRYQDSDNLYYAGLRVDGHVVIKKKIRGEYHTLLEKSLSPKTVYNKYNNNNLLLENTWIGLRFDVKNLPNNLVNLKLFMDAGHGWVKVLDTKDSVSVDSTNSLINSGFAGIRTDFMDVQFKDFKITEI